MNGFFSHLATSTQLPPPSRSSSIHSCHFNTRKESAQVARSCTGSRWWFALDLACEAAGLLITPLTTGTTARCSRPKPPGPTTELPVSRGCLVFWGARCGFTLSFPSLRRLERFIRSCQQPHIYADHSSVHTCSLLLNASHTSPSLASRVCASGCCGVVGGVVGGVMEGN